jgi:hypothetical protein
VCLKEKACQTYREQGYSFSVTENFFYSEEHRGWLCRSCVRALEKREPTKDLVDRMNERA